MKAAFEAASWAPSARGRNLVQKDGDYVSHMTNVGNVQLAPVLLTPLPVTRIRENPVES